MKNDIFLSRRAFALSGIGALALAAARRQDLARAQDGPYRPHVEPDAGVPEATALPVQDAYTFLVAGLDTRNVDDDVNTDVIMITRVDTATGVVRTMSLYRDLNVQYGDGGFAKINQAYMHWKNENKHDWNDNAPYFRNVVEQNFNLKIDGVVTTNLHRFSQVVDAVGGVTVWNPTDLYDATYPLDDYGTEEIYFPAGWVYLNGTDALKYCRTRHQDGDEGRVRRQQQVLHGMLYQLQSGDYVGQIPQLVESLRDAVLTDIPLEVQAQLMGVAATISPEAIYWNSIRDWIEGRFVEGGDWVFEADWTVLPALTREWLGVPPLDPSRS